MAHPDEYWQAIEPAYNLVFGGVDLPWEWVGSYKLRSALYPTYLAIPLAVLKYLGLDYAYAVKISPQIAHILLVILSDSFIWKIGKKTVGKNSTRLGFFILIISRIYNEQIIRTFSNSIESVFQTIAFYYFLKVTNKFDKNIIILTAALTVGFMMRNTSPIGWPPILAIKIWRDRSLIPFIIAGITIFIPTVCLCILIDSFYYGMKDFPVLTSYNFMRANLTEGLSKFFGTEPVHFYLFAVLPLIFTVAYPSFLAGLVVYPRD